MYQIIMSDLSNETSGIISVSEVVEDTVNLNTDTEESSAMHYGEIANALSPPPLILSRLRYSPSSQMCRIGRNSLLTKDITIGEKLELDYENTKEELEFIINEEGPSSSNYISKVDEAKFLREAIRDQKEKDPERVSGCFFSYAEGTVVNVLYDRGIDVPRKWEGDELKVFVSQKVREVATRSYELWVLKEVFICLNLLNRADQIDGAICDVVRHFIFPLFKARIEVELRRLCSFYEEFRPRQIAHYEELRFIELSKEVEFYDEEYNPHQAFDDLPDEFVNEITHYKYFTTSR